MCRIHLRFVRYIRYRLVGYRFRFVKPDIQIPSQQTFCWSARPQNISWRCLEEMSWRRLEEVFRVKIFCFRRRHQEKFARCLKDFLEVVTLKTFSRFLQHMPWRRFQDVLEITKFLLGIKQLTADANRKGIQQINFTANLDRVGDTYTISFLKK